MKLLCVGGMCAGEYFEVDEKRPVDSTVAIPCYDGLQRINLAELKASDTLEGKVQVYKLSVVQADKHRFIFLRNADLDTWEAMDRIQSVVNELTTAKLPWDWHMWPDYDCACAFSAYAELGDPYAPN